MEKCLTLSYTLIDINVDVLVDIHMRIKGKIDE